MTKLPKTAEDLLSLSREDLRALLARQNTGCKGCKDCRWMVLNIQLTEEQYRDVFARINT